MKTLREHLNENISSNINEAFDPIVFSGLSLAYMVIGFFERELGKGYMYNPENMIDDISNWIKDKKAGRIAKQLTQDKDVQTHMMNNEKTGWKDLILSKISKDDFKYLANLMKFDSNKIDEE